MPPARRLWTAVLLLAALAGPLRAGPRDELLRHVPDGVGFCLVVQDLRGHSAALMASPFADQFRRSAVGKALDGSGELKALLAIDLELERQIGLSWQRLRDDVLGDAFAFAYRPGPPGKPEDEQGLFLLRARDGKTLADLLDRIDTAQRKRGELEANEEREHNGVKYVRRTEKGKAPGFYHLSGPLLLYSGQEAMLRQALDAGRGLKPGAEPPLAARLRRLGADKALYAVWLNPRAFDAEVEAKAVGDAPGLRHVAACWKALDGLALWVRLEQDFALGVAAEARPEALPAAARRLLDEAVRPSAVWRSVPDDALFAAGARLGPATLLHALGEFLPAKQREALHADLNRTFGDPVGKDFVKEVLPHLGPDWGVCVTAPPAGGKEWLPQAVFALRVSGDPAADEALVGLLELYARLAVLGHNAAHADRPISLKRTTLDKREVRYLSGERAFPPGVAPAFALDGGRLLVASSPEALRRFGAAAAPAPPDGSPSPLLRVNFKGWRAWIAERREPLAAFLADKEQRPKEEVLASLAHVLAALEMIDRLEVRQQTTPGQVIVSVHVQTALPLRK